LAHTEHRQIRMPPRLGDLLSYLPPPSPLPIPLPLPGNVTVDTPTLLASSNSKLSPPTLNEVGKTTSTLVFLSVIPVPEVYDPAMGRASSESLRTSILRSVSLCQKAGETSVAKGVNWNGGVGGRLLYLWCICHSASGLREESGGGSDMARRYR
jgi:hypothetical protein